MFLKLIFNIFIGASKRGYLKIEKMWKQFIFFYHFWSLNQSSKVSTDYLLFITYLFIRHITTKGLLYKLYKVWHWGLRYESGRQFCKQGNGMSSRDINQREGSTEDGVRMLREPQKHCVGKKSLPALTSEPLF